MNLSEQVTADQAKFLKDQEARLLRAAEYLRDQIRAAIGQFSKSGKLLDSIKIKLEGKNVVVIYSDVEYASFVDKSKEFWTKTIEDSRPMMDRIIFGDR